MIQKLGRYSVVEKLGEDALGEIYRAIDNVLSRPVAIRAITGSAQWSSDLKLRFRHVCQSVSQVNHPNVVALRQLREEGNGTYLVMEFPEGKSLKTLIEERAPLSIEEKLSIMIQAADGLECAHISGTVHRDVRPGNVYLSHDGNVKIADFGIAHTLLSNRVAGPYIYLSPEQIQGEEGDLRCDIFSLGVVFYELLTHAHPFDNRDRDSHFFDAQVPTMEQFPELPIGLWPILEKCLAKDPDDRYQRVADFARACRELLDDLAEASELMAKELHAALPRLKRAGTMPGSSLKLARLARDVQRLVTGEGKPDHLSLQRLTVTLAEYSSFLRSVPEGPPPRVSAKVTQHAEIFQACEPREALRSEAHLENEGPDLTAEQSVMTSDAALAETQPNPPKSLKYNELQITDSTPADSEGAYAAEAIEPNQERRDSTEAVAGEQASNGRDDETKAPEIVAPIVDPVDQHLITAQSARAGARSRKLRLWIGGGVLSLLVIILAGLWVRNHFAGRRDIEDQIAEARLSLNQKHFDRALSLCRQILAASPQNIQAKALLYEAQAAKNQMTIDILIKEASMLLEQGRREESKVFLQRILEIKPEHDQAIALWNQFEAGLTAEALQRNGAGPNARVETGKKRPQEPGPAALGRREARNLESSRSLARTHADRLETELRQSKEEKLTDEVTELLNRGRYTEAQVILDRWLKADPRSSPAQALQMQTAEAQRSLDSFAAALKEKRYDAALSALVRVEEINPSDPNLPELRKRVEARKALASALLTIYRLRDAAMLTLDEQPIGSGGELENKSIPVGNHRIAIRNGRGLVAVKSQEFFDGQKVSYVYDASNLVLREMTAADREALAIRKTMEQVRRLPVEHNHAWFRSKCQGELVLNYFEVEYRPIEGSHGFRIPFRSLKLAVEGKKVELLFAADGKNLRTFGIEDDRRARALKQFWDELAALKR